MFYATGMVALLLAALGGYAEARGTRTINWLLYVAAGVVLVGTVYAAGASAPDPLFLYMRDKYPQLVIFNN